MEKSSSKNCLQDDSRTNRTSFQKWMDVLAAKDVESLSSHMLKLHAAMADPVYLDEMFEFLLRVGLHKVEGQPKPWFYNVERKRFKDAFSSDGKNSFKDQMIYVSFVMRKMQLPDQFHSAEALAELTIVNSLDFMVKLYVTARKAVQESVELWTLFRQRWDRLESFLKREEQTMAELFAIAKGFKESMEEFKAGKMTLESLKELDTDRKGIVNILGKRISDIDSQIHEEESKMPALLASTNEASILVENLTEMETILPTHIGNILLIFKMSFPDMLEVGRNFKPCEHHDKIEVVLESLKEKCKEIEILGNILLAETDEAKKDKVEEELKKQKAELKIILAKEETIFAFLKLNGQIAQLVKGACENNEIIKEKVDELLIKFNEHTKRHELPDQHAEIEIEFEQLIGIDEDEEEDDENEENDEKLETGGRQLN